METLRIEYISLSELRRAFRNPKDHDIGAIDASMDRFGFTAPVAINEGTGRLVAGHGRLDTLQQRKASGLPAPRRIREENGEWKIPVLRGLKFDTDEEAEAYLLADNRMTELGGWDDYQLAAVLSDLAAAEELEGIGWDESEIDNLLKQLGEPEIASVAKTGEKLQGMTPEEKYNEQYMTTTVRQIQLVMSQEEYEWALGVLQEFLEAEGVHTNTDAVLLLLKRWQQ